MRKGPRRGGLALIEVAVVIGVIAILVAIMIPAIRNARDAAVRARLPEFPWPPPTPSAFARIPQKLLAPPGHSANLGAIAEKLEQAFDRAGYSEKSYYAVPKGFALVSRLEQITADGTPKDPPARWSVRINNPVKFSLKSYLQALFTAQPGYFRIIVFVVSDQPFVPEPAGVSRDEAMNWLPHGMSALPPEVAAVPFSAQYDVRALIYEFEQQTRDHPAVLLIPSDIQGKTHIEKARLWTAWGDKS